MQARADEAFAYDVFQIKQVVLSMLGTKIRRRCFWLKWAYRLVISASSGDGHEFFLRIAKRGELAAKDTASVDVDGAIEPFGFGNRSVTVNNHSLTAVIGSPVVSDLQTKLINLAGGLTE